MDDEANVMPESSTVLEAYAPVHIPLGPRLAAFDPFGQLVNDASEIAQLVRGSEGAIIEGFVAHYRLVAPKHLRPSDSDLADFATNAAPIFQRQLARLDDQRWVDEVARYSTLVRGDILALTAVRGALSSQYGALAKLIVERLSGDLARCQRLAGSVNQIGWLEDCVIGNHFSENFRLAGEERERRAKLFRECIENGVSQASKLGTELRDRATQTSAATTNMLSKTSEVAAAAEQSAAAMREAAQTAAGLVRAIDTARGEVEVSVGIANRASAQLEDTVRVTETLSETAATVESVLQLIRTVAGRTKLLSLNATIEATRAGDAGRGFAVVAQEVKNLASQTAQATDDIAQKIAAIQSATATTVRANTAIRDTVAEVETSAGRLRTAIEEQALTVMAITAAVDETALAADTMSKTVDTIRLDTENVSGEIGALEQAFGRVNRELAALQEAARNYVEVA